MGSLAGEGGMREGFTWFSMIIEENKDHRKPFQLVLAAFTQRQEGETEKMAFSINKRCGRVIINIIL